MTEIEDNGNGGMWIKAIGFSGLYARSPNARYRVAWDDQSGIVVCLQGDDIMAQKTFENPTRARVSNRRTFALEYFTDAGTRVCEMYFDFTLIRKKLFRYSVQLAETRDGRTAVWFDDEGHAFVFDLARGL